MKNIFKERKIHIACVCLLLVMLLAGCSNLETDNQETDLFDVLNRADSVKIGNHIVVYNSESGNIYYGEMVNDKPKIIKNIALPYKNANVNQIIASDNWIYVVAEVMASEKIADIRVTCRYDLQMNLKEVNHTMYHNIYYKDGYLFGYDDGNEDYDRVFFYLTPRYIEATHYVKEENWKNQWNKISTKKKKEKVGSVVLYRHEDDLRHDVPYFSNNKTIPLFCGREICSSGIEQDGYTAEPYTFSRKKQNKILKELNLTNEKFDMSMLQDGDNIYGYCNVFKDGWVYNMYKGIDLKDIKKAFTFCYYFKSKKFKILQTFTNGELLGLANSEEVIYRKGNAIYTQALLDAKKTQKIFNCSHYGEIYAWGDIKKGSGISPVKNSSGKYFEVTEKNTILSDEEKFVVSIE